MDVYTDTNLPQETRSTSNKQPNLTPKVTKEKEERMRPKFSRRKNKINVRGEINEIETKKN